MSDTASLRPYSPRNYPVIPGGEPQFFNVELRAISKALAALITAVQALETRIETLESASE